MRLLIERGIRASKAKQVDQAIGYFRRATELAPHDESALSDLGLALERKGQLADAERTLRRSYEGRHDQRSAVHLAKFLTRRGNASIRRKQYEKAIALCHQALQIAPGEAFVLASLGRALYLSGDSAGAEAPLRQAIAADAESPARLVLADLLVDQGVAAANAHRVDEAIADFRSSAALDPRDGSAHYHLGLALAERGDDVAALEAVDRSLTEQASRDAHELRAAILRRLGRPREAALAFAAARALGSDIHAAPDNASR